VAVGDLLDRDRLLQPSGSQVGAQGRDLDRHGLVRGHVPRREELPHLRLGGVSVAAEEQVGRARSARGGQEIVRVAAEHGDVHVQDAQQLGGHQAEQVRAGGLAEAGHLGEGVLGAGGAAELLVRFQDDHLQARAGQQNRGDQAVVAGSDDHYVRAGGNRRGHGVGL
jgi:hypothetical protein